MVAARGLAEVAGAAELVGFQSGWVGDHIVYPVTYSSRNPSTKAGVYGLPLQEPQLEAMATLAFAAAVTNSLRLIAGVFIAAYRPPLLLAKQAATLSLLSDGRFEIGLGVGWLKEEFDAIGANFDQRVGRLVETAKVLAACWGSDQPEFHGRYFEFGPVHFSPRPKVPPTLWLGGHSEPALRRAALLADGWVGYNLAPEEVAAAVATLRRHRPDSKPPVRVCINAVVNREDPRGAFDRVHGLREVGCDEVALDQRDDSPAGLLGLIEVFTHI
jgi:probable F420-dependent oxidoreductase